MAEQLQITVDNLQTQLSAVQAAIDGNTNSSLFKQPPFNGLPNEDVNEWLAKFDRLSKFYSWSNAKKLGALPLMLGGPALAWFQTLTNETANDYQALIEALKDRFRAQNLDFILRQELYARKQGPTEPLSVYTEDLIRKCQRLSLSDIEMMNLFINGLKNEIKSHVILNQPKTFAEADNLARLRSAVFSTSVSENLLPSLGNTLQEQRIKELEGQVNLLMTYASQKQQQKPVHAIDTAFQSSLPLQNGLHGFSNAFNSVSYGQNELHNMNVAAIDNRFQHPVHKNPQISRRSFQNGARGRNLRTTDGQPICNSCQRVGHVSRYCNLRQQNPAPSQNQRQFNFWQRQSNFENDRFDQSRYQQTRYGLPRFQQSQPSIQQNLNGNGSSRLGN